MTTTFSFFSTASAWEFFNGGSGDTLASVDARGGDGLLAGADYELRIQNEAGADQDTANMAWNTQRDVDYTLSWDKSTQTLTFELTNPEIGETRTLSWVLPANQSWSTLSIRVSVPNDGEAKTARVQTLSTEFNGDLLGVYELDVDGTTVAGAGSTVNVTAIVVTDDTLNESWTLTGSLRFSWGLDSAPVVPAGEESPGTTNPAVYPDGDNMIVTFGLSDPGAPRSTADIKCLQSYPGTPPTCQVATGDSCFRYRYDCDDGEWVLNFAECVDNSLCATEQETTCENERFEFEERNTCVSGEAVPTPTFPNLTDGCLCA